MNHDLALALELCDAADAISMKSFRSASLSVRVKADHTPVSEADEAIETMIRERLGVARPSDGIVGEELGVSGGGSRRWIIDPIDATKNYVRGIPIFATLLALQENDRIVAGVVSAPALARRWWASAEEGAFCNGERIAVSRIGALEDAHLGYDSIVDFDQNGNADPFLALMRRCARSRGFGDFWSHMLVAEGAIDVAIEPRVAMWDMAPVRLIVAEAGGRFSDLRGEDCIDGTSALSTNGQLHEAVLEVFR